MRFKSLIQLLRTPIAQQFKGINNGYNTNVSKSADKTQKSIKVLQEPGRKNVTMSGWQISSYGDLNELQFCNNLRVPKIYNSNECLIKVQTTAVNPIDVAMISGYGGTIFNLMRCNLDSIEFPIVLGREFCGEIIQKGLNVDNKTLPLGCRVWGVVPIQNTKGAHAEYVVVPDYCISQAPSLLTNAEATSVLYAGLTAWSGITFCAQYGCSKPHIKRILILGASGSVGSLATQILKAEGAEVIATCHKNAVDNVKNLGADYVIDYTNDLEYSTLHDHSPYDVVLDCCGLGSQGAQHLDFKFDQYITFTSPFLINVDESGLIFGNIRNMLHIVEMNYKAIIKHNLVKWGFFFPSPQGIADLKNLVEKKKLLPIIDSTYVFKDMPLAFQRVQSGHLRGKVVVNVN